MGVKQHCLLALLACSTRGLIPFLDAMIICTASENQRVSVGRGGARALVPTYLPLGTYRKAKHLPTYAVPTYITVSIEYIHTYLEHALHPLYTVLCIHYMHTHSAAEKLVTVPPSPPVSRGHTSVGKQVEQQMQLQHITPCALPVLAQRNINILLYIYIYIFQVHIYTLHNTVCRHLT